MTDWEIIKKYRDPDRTDADVVLYYERYEADPEFRERAKIFSAVEALENIETARYQNRKAWRGYGVDVLLILAVVIGYRLLPAHSALSPSEIYFFPQPSIPLLVQWGSGPNNGPIPDVSDSFAQNTRPDLNQLALDLHENLHQKEVHMGVDSMTLLPGEVELRGGHVAQAKAACRAYTAKEVLAYAVFDKYADLAFKEKQYAKAFRYYSIFIDESNEWEEREELKARTRQVLCILADWQHLKRHYPTAMKSLKDLAGTKPSYFTGLIAKIEAAVERR